MTQSRNSARLLVGGCRRGAVEHVEFVGEFVIDDVMALFRVAAAVQDGVPDEDERPLLEGLSDDRVGDLDRSERVSKWPILRWGGTTVEG